LEKKVTHLLLRKHKAIPQLKTKYKAMQEKSSKECRKCGEVKSLSAFLFRKDTGKHRGVCKDCRNKQVKEYHKLNKEFLDKYREHYRSENKDKIKEANLKYYKENRTNILLQKLEYQKQSAEQIKAYQLTAKRKWSKLCQAAKARNISVELTFEQYEELIKSRECGYCQRDFSQSQGGNVDRINNEKGYELDNCVACCSTCNSIKMDFNKDELLPSLKGLLKFFGETND
jgi:hypothetical protein